LVGGEISLADIIVSLILLEPLQTVLDSGLRKAMKNLSDWT